LLRNENARVFEKSSVLRVYDRLTVTHTVISKAMPSDHASTHRHFILRLPLNVLRARRRYGICRMAR